MKYLFVLFLPLVAGTLSQAQSGTVEGKSGVFYFGIGTHKIFYTKSDLHLIGTGSTPFDLTLKKVKAKDDFFLKKPAVLHSTITRWAIISQRKILVLNLILIM
jgi:hypothetical protein